MGYKEADRAGAGYPTLEVKRVALNDGLHASLILENGRISKLVSPSGEVAVLKWEGDQTFPRPSPASTSQLHPPRVSPRVRATEGPDGFAAACHFWASKGAAGSQQPAIDSSIGRGHRSTPERSASMDRAPANISDSKKGNAKAVPGLAEGPSMPEALPQDTAIEPEMQSNHAESSGAVGFACQEIEPDAEEAEAVNDDHEGMMNGRMDTVRPATTLRSGQGIDLWPEVAVNTGTAEDGAAGRLEKVADEEQTLPTLSEHDQADIADCQRLEAHSSAQHAGGELVKASQQNMAAGHAVNEPEEARHHSMAGEHTADEPEEASQHGSKEDDRLEELMGAVPTINLRELRTQVASLPEILSRAQRTAELCARKSVPGGAGRQNLNPQKLADGSIHSWVAQSRATAILIQRDQHVSRHPHSFSTPFGAVQTAQPRHEHAGPGHEGRQQTDLSRAQGSPAEPNSQAQGSPSAASSADSPRSVPPGRLTARRSLAEVRAAIGIALSPEAAATGKSPQEATEEEKPKEEVHLSQTSSEKKVEVDAHHALQATAPVGASVWRRLVSVFPGRRVRPESAGVRPSSAASETQPALSRKLQQRSVTERLFGTTQRRLKGITLAEWPEKPSGQSPAAAQPSAKPIQDIGCTLEAAAVAAMQQPAESAATSLLTQQTATGQSTSTRKVHRLQSKATANRTGMAGRWRMSECEGALAGAQQVEDLLDLPLLQRLAQQRAQEICILESDDTFEFIQIIALNGKAKIARCTKYLKSGKMIETSRADSREGMLRSQLNISPEGHCHMRSLQGEPYAAVFHRRIKMSSGGHRLKIEQKFQLLSPGIMPVKYHSIWHRIDDRDADDVAAPSAQQGPLLSM